MASLAVTSHICGGLGNQMFQYAAARDLSLRLGVPLFLNVDWFRNIDPESTSRVFQLNEFPRIALAVEAVIDNSFSPAGVVRCIVAKALHSLARLCRRSGSRLVYEPHFHFWDGIKSLSAPVALHGYWQSERYFSDHSVNIREDFIFSDLPRGSATAMEQRIRACELSVSVHIRRGDYVADPQTQAFHGVMGHDYYSVALDSIRQLLGNATLFLFSDDPQWVREHFDCRGHEGVVVDLGMPDEPHHDMHLMSLCRHHVIANSSFSWWGAWLGSEGGVTIAPSKWFADESVNTSDVYPESWLRV